MGKMSKKQYSLIRDQWHDNSYKIFAFFYILYCVRLCAGECQLIKEADGTKNIETEKRLLSQIKPLEGTALKTEDEIYIYYVTICDKVKEQPNNGVGALQISKNKTKQSFTLGRYDMMDIMGGTDWMLLTYYGGDKYGDHCNHSERVTTLMIVCDPTRITGEFRILEERKRHNASNCFYLFELGSSVACNATEKKAHTLEKLSSGSVFCIIFFTVCGLYLLIGFLYKRIVVGAKGLEQIPNYGFWQEFGNLQADGCDFACRFGSRRESQAYRGIDDRLKTEEERDDQILNM